MPLDLISVLAEPNRRRLISLLGAGERTVTELAAEFPVSRSAISQHLAVLVEAGLVEARKAGRFRHYRLVPDGLAALRTEIDHFWTAEVEALARVGPDTEVDPLSYERSVFMPVPPAEAFALLTEPERLRRWQTVAARIDLRSGGEFRWVITPPHVVAGTVVDVDPGRRLVITWGWEGNEGLPPGASTVTVTLAEADGGTFVRLVHDDLPEDQLAGHAAGWDHYLERLVAIATDGEVGPDPWSATPDPLNEVTAFGAALAVCQRVAVGITDADLTKPTPCAQFDVGQLVDHLLGSIVALGGMAGADVVVSTSGTVEDRIATTAAPALEAWQARGLEGEVGPAGHEMPAAMAAGILAIELLVHAWDLAQATGGTVEASDGLTDEVLTYAARVIRPEARDGVQFGQELDAGPDAGSLDRLVAFTGRTPIQA